MEFWYVKINGKKVQVNVSVAEKYGCRPGMTTPFTGLMIYKD